MDFTALFIQTEAFQFNNELHEGDDHNCEVDLDLNVKTHKGQIVSVMDMQYYSTHERLTPLASLRTVFKFWVGENEKEDTLCSERILFSLKTQHRYSCFVLHQKLKEHNIKRFVLPEANDEELFRVVYAPGMAALAFDEVGNYVKVTL